MRLEEWRFSATLAWRDPFMRWATLACLLVAFGMTGYVLTKLIPQGLTSGVLATHYTMYLGIDDVRAWPWVFSIPAGIIALIGANAIVAAGIFRTDPLATRMLTALSCAATIVWTVGSLFLVRINL